MNTKNKQMHFHYFLIADTLKSAENYTGCFLHNIVINSYKVRMYLQTFYFYQKCKGSKAYMLFAQHTLHVNPESKHKRPNLFWWNY